VIRERWRSAFQLTILMVALSSRLLYCAPPLVEPLWVTGPPANRIDIVFLSEGFTEADLTYFHAQTSKLLNGLLKHEPFSSYRGYFNLYALFVASAEKGSDHPSVGQFRDTYFNSSYDSYGLPHALTIPPNGYDPDPSHGYGKAHDLLAQVLPEWDMLVFIVFDGAWGAWGDDRGVVISSHALSLQSLLHELGHALAGLGDEYDDPFPEDPAPIVEEPNTTRETRREMIKWKAWIAEQTPIPTPNTGAYSEVVGLFEGARYNSFGWFRPRLQCMMRDMFSPFCEVCREALTRSIYRRVSPIDFFQPAERRLALAPGQATNLSVEAMRPVDHSLTTRWFVDGTPVAQAVDSISITAEGLGTGIHRAAAQVSDETPHVRSDPDGVLRDVVVWEIHVAGSETERPFGGAVPRPTSRRAGRVR
jgi:hypothetical protein